MIKIKSTDKAQVLEELRKYSIIEMLDTLADYIVMENAASVQRVILTPEQFNVFFRIRGLQGDITALVNEDPTAMKVERRGRPRKNIGDVIKEKHQDDELPL